MGNFKGRPRFPDKATAEPKPIKDSPNSGEISLAQSRFMASHGDQGLKFLAKRLGIEAKEIIKLRFATVMFDKLPRHTNVFHQSRPRPHGIGNIRCQSTAIVRLANEDLRGRLEFG